MPHNMALMLDVMSNGSAYCARAAYSSIRGHPEAVQWVSWHLCPVTSIKRKTQEILIKAPPAWISGIDSIWEQVTVASVLH